MEAGVESLAAWHEHEQHLSMCARAPLDFSRSQGSTAVALPATTARTGQRCVRVSPRDNVVITDAQVKDGDWIVLVITPSPTLASMQTPPSTWDMWCRMVPKMALTKVVKDLLATCLQLLAAATYTEGE